jgi:hypothetical protein
MERRRMGWRHGLLVVAVAGVALIGCTKNNATFCDTIDDCESGQDCIGNVCETIEIPDASIECPVATHQCIELAPDGWSGPALRADALAGETPPTCPADYSDATPTTLHGLSADGSCACTCGNAATLACSDARIEGRDDSSQLNCQITQCLPGSCPSTTLTPNTCTTFSPASAEPRYKQFRGSVTSGTCEPGTPADNLNPAAFSDQTSLCSASAAALGEGCAMGSTCAELAPDGFDAEMCIFQAGTHDCPEGSIFSERLLTFDSIDDQRSCDTCDCDVGVGGTCGTIAIYTNSTNCSTAGIALSATCTDNLGGAVPRAEYHVAASGHPCEPVAASPPPTGEATGADPTTVCCVPPSE